MRVRLLCMLLVAVFAGGAVAFAAAHHHHVQPPPATATGADPVLLGTTTVQATSDGGQGASEAFGYTATVTGTANSASVYLTSTGGVTLGLYADNASKPGALLDHGSVASNAKGWVTVALTGGVQITAGARYWIAIYAGSSSKTIAYRDAGNSGSNLDYSGSGLSNPYSTNGHWSSNPASAYIAGTTGTTSTSSTSSTSTTTTSPTSTSSTTTTPTTSTTTTSTTTTAAAGANCLTLVNGQPDYAALDACGYPSPDTTGVPAGTPLTPVGSINCSNQTINAVSTSGSVSIGSNCTITNSHITGEIVVQNGPTNVTLAHDEIGGAYTGTPANPACSYNASSGAGGQDSAVLWEGDGADVTLSYDYLHCAAEPFNGSGNVANSYIIADECWGPCGSGSTTHNEAIYIAGGQSGTGSAGDYEHNTILNPFAQTAGIFGDDHAFGPLRNLTISNNLVADGGDNGAIVTGSPGDGNANVRITGNRISWAYDPSMPSGGPGGDGTTWSGNFRDDTLAPTG